MKAIISIFILVIILVSVNFPVAQSSDAKIQSLKSKVYRQKKFVWKIHKRLLKVENLIEKGGVYDSLDEDILSLGSSIDDLDNKQNSISSKIRSNSRLIKIKTDKLSSEQKKSMDKLEKKLNSFKHLSLFAILLILFIIIFLFIKMKRLKFIPANVDNQKGLLGKQEQLLNDIGEKEDNHSFYIRTAEEIFRMRTRINRMPKDTKGISALSNALNRLEDELNIKGYTIIDLSGTSYNDGMSAHVRDFIPKDDLGKGIRKIARMTKPQVVFKDIVLTHGEIEVEMSTEDLSQN